MQSQGHRQLVECVGLRRGHDGEKMSTLEGKVSLITWMLGFNIILSLAILGKLLR